MVVNRRGLYLVARRRHVALSVRAGRRPPAGGGVLYLGVSRYVSLFATWRGRDWHGLVRSGRRGGPLTIIKLHSERHGGQVTERVYVGRAEDDLRLAGTLVLDIGQWQDFGVALALGAGQTDGRVRVILAVADELTVTG